MAFLNIIVVVFDPFGMSILRSPIPTAFNCRLSAVVMLQSIDLQLVNFELSGEYTLLAPLQIHVPSHDLGTWRASAMFAKLDVHVKANSSLSSSSTAATVAVLDFFPLPFFCLGPCPSLPPPFAQQSAFLWPFFLQQLWHTMLELAVRAFSLGWPCLSLSFSHGQLIPGLNSVFSRYL